MKSSEILIKEENGSITAQPRALASAIISLAGFSAAAALLAVAHALSASLPEYSRFAAWGGAVLAGVSACVLFSACFVCASRVVTIDARNGVLRRGNRTYSAGAISDIQCVSRTIMDQEIVSIVADVRGRRVILVSGHSTKHRAVMQQAAEKMKALVVQRSPGRPAVQVEAPAGVGAALSMHIVGIILICFGAILAASALLLIPDLVLTRAGARFGFLFWPVGIWIAAAGAMEILGVGIIQARTFRGQPLQIILLAIWAISYFVITFRPL